MMTFKKRSNQEELMDNLDLDKRVLKLALKDISLVNKLLGGNTITLNAIKRIINCNPKAHYKITDIGCGSGAMLREVALFCRKNHYNVSLVGIDMNSKSLDIAEEFSEDFPEITYKNLNIFQAEPKDIETDILLCTLTLHHFKTEDIERFVKTFVKISSKAIIINDLQRSKLAYLLFHLFSRIFLKTQLARIDGLISIKRGFKKQDLQHISATLKASSLIQWKWAFRYLWVITPNNTL
jgi:2-polyprenyl-3-methyl-5-hydroxy-6-metoxy-1,4-benzoquinol methylase